MTPVDPQVIVITGASSGFGKGAALAFARRGHACVLAARRGALLETLARQCERLDGTAIAVPTDVSRPEEVRALLDAALRRYGRVDVWINNAGVGALGPFERVPLPDQTQVIATNLLGTLYGSYVAYQHFLERRRGILINVASELGRHTVPYYAAYTASKHGVVGLSDALRQEVLQKQLDDIHICTVLPTAHDTPFFDHAANYTGHQVAAPSPLHDPQAVVDALVRLARNPRDREIVGADGVLKILLKNFAPGFSERMAAKQMHATQMTGPPAPDTPGAVQEPTEAGTGVSGGRS